MVDRNFELNDAKLSTLYEIAKRSSQTYNSIAWKIRKSMDLWVLGKRSQVSQTTAGRHHIETTTNTDSKTLDISSSFDPKATIEGANQL